MTNRVSEIPLITNPLGRHWPQPKLAEITIDETHALMSEETLGRLLEYTYSQPTGVYVGKMWKRRVVDGRRDYLLCWYGLSEKGADYCSINYRKILVVA